MEITKEELKELAELASGIIEVSPEELKELESLDGTVEGETTELYCFLQFGRRYKKKIDVTEPLKALLTFLRDSRES